MRTLLQDLRYCFRMLWKSPGFTVIAVVTLALGIGVNSAIFSGVSAFILRPMPVERPDELVRAFEVSRADGEYNDVSYPDYIDYRDQTGVFDGLLAHTLVQAALSDKDQNDIIYGELVSGNYFDVLRVHPLLGRGFLADEDKTPGAAPVVVLGYNLWQRRFNSDPNLVGKVVTLNGQQYTVVGVTPETFKGTKWALSMDFWVPAMMQAQIDRSSFYLDRRNAHNFDLVGRLKPGVSVEQAGAAMTTVSARLSEAYPNIRGKNIGAVVMPETSGRFDEAAGRVALSAGLAMMAVGLILLIACANVANLLLARSLARRREIGIRLALGASRLRLIRQLLTESVMLSVIGGILGMLLAYWATDLMWSFVPALPYNFEPELFTPDTRVLAFTLVLSLATGVIFGLAPALQSSNPDVLPVLKGETPVTKTGTRRLTLRNLLVVSQVALSLIVLVCAGLFVKSARNAQSIDPGFKTDNVLALSVNPGLLGYTQEQGNVFYRQLVEHVEALPGVESASVATLLPLGDSSHGTGPVVPEGQPLPPPDEDGGYVLNNTVGPKHFETLKVPLLAGRDFNERDGKDAPKVVIINETLARRLWPNEDPLGKRLTIGRKEDRPLWEVIGVARDGKYRTLGETPKPYMYFHLPQDYEAGMTLLIRTANDPKSLTPAVREVVRNLDSRLPIYGVMTLQEHMGYALMWTRMGAKLSTTFGLLALLLAATGLYSLMAYSVGQRTREIGIRMALGAQRGDVLRLVAVQGMRLAVAGIVVGIPLAFVLTRVMSGLLYGVSAADPLIFIVVPVLLGAVALLACYIPARRATRVDPMIALRYE
jgi:macrolide transport system ATP-binding/permease protein